MDSTKSSRRERERDREVSEDHRESSKDHRDRDHNKHRSISKHKSSRDADEDYHSHRSSTDKHRSKAEKHRDHGDDDHRHRSRDDRDRERSHEPRADREGSRDRAAHDRDKRGRSHERVREESVERRYSSKRKERGDSEDRHDGGEKRSRVSDEVKEEKKERKERRRFGDKVEELNGNEKEERRGKRRFEDGGEDTESRDASTASKVEKRERRRFGDRVKKEDVDVDEEGVRGTNDEKKAVKVEPKDELNATRGGAPSDNTVNVAPPNMASNVVQDSLGSSHLHPIKVSSISTTNENKGVSNSGSHEVPGKSSTDGPASASRSGNLSLDVLAKAKRALQMQKELSEKLKKLPTSSNGASSQGSTQMVSKQDPAKALAPSRGSVTTPVGSSSLPAATAGYANPTQSGLASNGKLTEHGIEAVMRAQEFAAKLGFQQDPQFAPLINMFPGQVLPEVTFQPKPSKAPVLRLDALGREIDEHGNVVNTTKVSNLSTLKVNINKQKKEAFQILKPELDVDPEKNPHFDARMGIDANKLLRPKRSTFQFVEEGKWSRDAETIKLKSQFGEAQAKELKVKQAQLAKAKAEPDINPNLIEVSERVITKAKPKDPIPEVEWWDQPLLRSGNYGDINDGGKFEDIVKTEKINIYVEHPRPIEPPAEPAPPPPQPLKLTKKEQKKLRTQRRLAREKDRQEMIRQGILEPPKSKVKMSNLMKVLGSEATQDPTKLEMEIRSAAAEREQAHIDRNIARKLTPDERREKKEKKLFDDPNTAETIVSVYKINDLSHPQTRFKVDVNAQENRLSGCAVISEGFCVVVVEGGSKSIKRYGKLMLKRIDWASAVKTEDDDDMDEDDKPVNKCWLVWQGSVAKNSFHRFSVHECRTEAAARKVFSDAGVLHYWDLAANHAEEM